MNNILFPVLKGKNAIDIDGNQISGIYVDPTTPVKKRIVSTVFEDANNYMKDGVCLRQVIDVVDNLDLTDYQERHDFAEIYETILHDLQSAGNAGEFYTPRPLTNFMAKMVHPKIGERCADFACGTGGFLTSYLSQLRSAQNTVNDVNKINRSLYGIEKKQFPYVLCVTNLLLHDVDEPNIIYGNSLSHNALDYTEEDKFEVILMNPPYGGAEKDDVKNHFPSDLASSETADLFMVVIMYRLKKYGRAAVILPDGFLFNTDNSKTAIKKKLFREFNLHTIVRLPGSVFAPYTSITTNILFFDNNGPTKETWFYRLDMPEGYLHFSKTKPIKDEHLNPVIEWWDSREEITIDGFPKAKKYTAKEIEELNYDINLCGFPHEEEEILPPDEIIKSYRQESAALDAKINDVLNKIEELLGQ